MPLQMLKSCSQCGVEKPFTDFSRDRSRATGRCPACKQCQGVRYTPVGRGNARRMPGQTKVCRMCGVELGPLPIPPVLVCSERCYFSYKLEGKYGITIDDYEHLLHAQNGVC